MLPTRKTEDVANVLGLALLQPDKLKIRVYAIIPHLYGRTVVGFWSKNLSTLLFCVYPYLSHLFIQLDDHHAQPARQGISAIACHFFHHVQPFKNSVGLELLHNNLVVSSDQGLL